jgi:S1-C subfamily serine protease
MDGAKLNKLPNALSSVGGQRASAQASQYRLLGWLILTGVVVAVFVYLGAPTFMERIEYSRARGRERGGVEAVRSQLPSLNLSAISRAFSSIAKAIAPSVVHIETVATYDAEEGFSGFFSRPVRYQARAEGSGVIIDRGGYVLTNYHVVKDADGIEVRLSDGEIHEGRIVGLDSATDLALVKIDADDLIAAEWGDSDALQTGDLVWAVGNPFGLDRSVTFGIISARDRRGLTDNVYQDFLQTDAAVNPGNSGGPLVNATGKVVGINTAMLGRAQGISLSIPANLAKEVYEKLRTSGRVERGWLGIAVADLTPELAKRLDAESLKGALVVKVVDESGAKSAGLRPGDIIVEFDGHPVADAAEATLLIAKSKIGATVKIVASRSGTRTSLEATIESRPAGASRTY